MIVPLTTRQAAISAAIGVGVFLAAALLIRFLQPLQPFADPTRLFVYALVIPGTVPVIPMIRRLAGLAPGQTVAAMAMGTGAATLCDGIALAWFPALYGTGDAHIAGAGALILWGAAVGLLLAFLLPDHKS